LKSPGGKVGWRNAMGIKDVIVRNEAAIKQYLELGYVNEKDLLKRQ
jgi:hypothetical protein